MKFIVIRNMLKIALKAAQCKENKMVISSPSSVEGESLAETQDDDFRWRLKEILYMRVLNIYFYQSSITSTCTVILFLLFVKQSLEVNEMFSA